MGYNNRTDIVALEYIEKALELDLGEVMKIDFVTIDDLKSFRYKVYNTMNVLKQTSVCNLRVEVVKTIEGHCLLLHKTEGLPKATIIKKDGSDYDFTINVGSDERMKRIKMLLEDNTNIDKIKEIFGELSKEELKLVNQYQ